MLGFLFAAISCVGIELAVHWAKRGDWPGVIKGSLLAIVAGMLAAAHIIARAG